MSAQFTLDSIREAADAKYGYTEIVVDDTLTVKMLNPLRLAKADRAALMGIQDELKAEDVDQIAVFGKAIVLVSEDKVGAQKLVDMIGDDLALLAQVFSTYTTGTSAGEASASAN